jgi:hypothetical protein
MARRRARTALAALLLGAALGAAHAAGGGGGGGSDDAGGGGGAGGACEHDGTCEGVLNDDEFAAPAAPPPPPPPPPPPHAQRHACARVDTADFEALFGKDGFSLAKWQDDEAGRCWCFEAQAAMQAWRGLRFWGRTRVVRLDRYDADRMHLWVEGDEPSLRAAMVEDNDSFLLFFMRHIPGMRSHSCTPFGAQGTCVVRTSPFENICVGVKAKPKADATLTVTHAYDKATLLPLLGAAVLFLAAPTAAYSLWSYYLTASGLMAVCCVGVLAFWLARRFLGPHQVAAPAPWACSRRRAADRCPRRLRAVPERLRLLTTPFLPGCGVRALFVGRRGAAEPRPQRARQPPGHHFHLHLRPVSVRPATTPRAHLIPPRRRPPAAPPLALLCLPPPPACTCA